MLTRRVSQQLLTCVLSIVIFYGLLGTEVQCTPAEARPSMESLQTQIDQLNDRELHVFNRNGEDLGVLAGRESSTYYVYLPQLNATVRYVGSVLSIGDQRVFDTKHFYFESIDCTGPAYIDDPARLLIVQDSTDPNSVLYLLGAREPVLITINSMVLGSFDAPSESCNTLPEPRSGHVVPFEVVDPVALGIPLPDPPPPLPAPLYLAPLSSAP